MKKSTFKHVFLALIVFICWVVIVLGVGVYTFLTTTWGAKKAVKYLAEVYIPFCKLSVGSYQGTIEKGFSLKNITIDHIPTMKQGNVHVQEVYVQIPLIRWDQVFVKIVDARLNLPSAEPIIFNGTVKQNKIEGNCFASSVDAKQVVGAFGYEELAKSIYGYISRIDFHVGGLVNVPRFTGHFFLDKFDYKGTQVSDGFGHLDLSILSLGDNPMMSGPIVLESAIINTHKISVDLITSEATFKGDVQNPVLDIHGTSKVEDVKIDMSIKGTLQKPQLVFNSDPPMSEEQILMTLVTGKTWSGLDNDRSGAFGLRRKLSNAFNVGMGVEEILTPPGSPSQSQGYSKTIEGQMNLTDKFSLNVARKFNPTSDATTSSDSSQPAKDKEAEFYLQYKERF